MDVVDAVPRLGWSPTRKELIDATSRRAFDRAVAEGRVVRLAHGRYGLPGRLDGARSAAVRVNGVMSHLTAALHWEFSVKTPPERPVVTVPRWRSLPEARRSGVEIRWSNLPDNDIADGVPVTTPLRTVLDCAATLPLPEALVVADSALRTPFVTQAQLRAAAGHAPAKFRSRVARVAAYADGRAESALESLVRGIAADVPGLDLRPQVHVAGRHPDLYDERLRLVVECDSFEFHSRRADLLRDCEPYNVFALEQLVVVRFGWEHAMRRPDYIRQTLTSLVGLLAAGSRPSQLPA